MVTVSLHALVPAALAQSPSCWPACAACLFLRHGATLTFAFSVQAPDADSTTGRRCVGWLVSI